MGIDEMQKALREAGTQLRETHERNERQLQVVSVRVRVRMRVKRSELKMGLRMNRFEN